MHYNPAKYNKRFMFLFNIKCIFVKNDYKINSFFHDK